MPVKPRKSLHWLPYALGSFVVGACLALAGLFLLIASRTQLLAANAAAAPATAIAESETLTATPEQTASQTPALLSSATATATITATATAIGADVITSAENALQNNDPELVFDLLLPLLDTTQDPLILARANELLGDAEIFEDSNKLAIGYYEDAYYYSQSVATLYKLATACSNSGELTVALNYFKTIVNWDGPEADPYRQEAQSNIDWLREALNIPTTFP